MSPHRCDENCLSCEGSSRNCSRCRTGFTQLGTSCVTNHTCSNGEPRGWRPGRRGGAAALGAGVPGAPSSQASDADRGHFPPPTQPLLLGLSSDLRNQFVLVPLPPWRVSPGCPCAAPSRARPASGVRVGRPEGLGPPEPTAGAHLSHQEDPEYHVCRERGRVSGRVRDRNSAPKAHLGIPARGGLAQAPWQPCHAGRRPPWLSRPPRGGPAQLWAPPPSSPQERALPAPVSLGTELALAQPSTRPRRRPWVGLQTLASGHFFGLPNFVLSEARRLPLWEVTRSGYSSSPGKRGGHGRSLGPPHSAGAPAHRTPPRPRRAPRMPRGDCEGRSGRHPHCLRVCPARHRTGRRDGRRCHTGRRV